MNELINRLRQTVGDSNVLVDGDLSAWEQDWRKRSRGKALAVVRPASTAEVAGVVQACAAARTAIVPQGGNTGLCGGATPLAAEDAGRFVPGGGQIVLKLGRLNRVRALDPVSNTITVEAGCVLANLQQAAAEAGRLFPLSLAA